MTFLYLQLVLSGAVFVRATSALLQEVRAGRDVRAALWALVALVSAYFVLANVEALR